MSYIGLYFCNCKAGFDTPQERTMHMGTCVTMQRAQAQMTPPPGAKAPHNVLGPLEFKAEDFGSIKMEMTNGRIITDIVRLDEALTLLNRLLAERLGKAPEVFLTRGYGHYDKWIEDESELDAEPTHRARLVCIEQLEGK